MRRIRPAFAIFIVLLCEVGAAAQNSPRLPELSRTLTGGEFVSSVGRRAALLGTLDRGFEAWVYPLKILRDLHVRFHLNGSIVAAESIARSVITRPESTTIVYSEAAFQVRETLFVPIHEPGAMIIFDIRTEHPLQIEVAFKPEFELEWPAKLGQARVKWDASRRVFVFTAQEDPYAAIVGTPTAADGRAGNGETAASEASLLLEPTQRGSATSVVCLAASLQGPEDAKQIYDRLLNTRNKLVHDAADYYADYLRRTINITVPDAGLQQGYEWARINLIQALVDNPLVGTGLIAGYGPSGPAERPGFDWFFGRDALWSSFALDSEGDFPDARTALEFIAKYQRSDGKIPHEIPQSTTLVPWFEDYPYGYASADATPLFLIAVDEYVKASGDVSFARQEWQNVWRAYQFLHSTLDADGFARNSGVGHGWVESGPLVPVRTEIYQAALGTEALRAVSDIARVVGQGDLMRELNAAFEHAKDGLNNRFWSADKRIFAFALDSNGARVDEATVMPAVPLWFGLLDPAKAKEMIEHLADPDLQTDWGMRLLSSSSPHYESEGYHHGSVWPLFTGWTAVGEYRYHAALSAYQNLRANALLAQDGSAGHVTEVLAGNYYEPLSASTPQQIWSAAMIVSPLIQGLLGLSVNAQSSEISLSPHVPADWRSFSIDDIHVGSNTLTLHFEKSAEGIRLETTRSGGSKTVLEFSPAISLRATVVGATLNGRKIRHRVESNDADQHVLVRLEIPSGRSSLYIRVRNDFELSATAQLPPMGSSSKGLRIFSSDWNSERNQLFLDLAGVPGNIYEFSLFNAGEIASMENAELKRPAAREPKLIVRFPSGGDGYVPRRITLRFRANKEPTSVNAH